MAPQTDISPLQELRIQAQWRELEKKNQIIKLNWFQKNYEKVYLNPPEQLKFTRQTEKLAAELKSMRAMRFQNDRNERLKFQRKKQVLPPYKRNEVISWDDVVIRPPMLPVPVEFRETLYQGISHNDEGRKKYLKLRNKQELEDKFYEPITYQQEYGWNIQKKTIPFTRYGRRAIVKKTFNQRNGALKINSPFWREPASNSPPSYLC